MTNFVLDKLYFSPVKSLSFINTKNLIIKKDVGIKNDRILAFTRIINEEEANDYQKNPNKRNLKFFLTLKNSPFLNKYKFQLKDDKLTLSHLDQVIKKISKASAQEGLNKSFVYEIFIPIPNNKGVQKKNNRIFR